MDHDFTEALQSLFEANQPINIMIMITIWWCAMWLLMLFEVNFDNCESFSLARKLLLGSVGNPPFPPASTTITTIIAITTIIDITPSSPSPPSSPSSSSSPSPQSLWFHRISFHLTTLLSGNLIADLSQKRISKTFFWGFFKDIASKYLVKIEYKSQI